ncbi:hypothetical protein KD681_004535 [Salmonella enterica subsp. enterica serovar Singapore]|nr:hypothetical protein [Salmonella enterica subsp. enterica serovar Singapore]
MALPERDYYNFNDALTYIHANKMQCSISDLIHFSETGRLIPITFFRGFWQFDCHQESRARSLFIDMNEPQPNKIITINQNSYEESHYTSNLCSYHILAEEPFTSCDRLMIMLRGFLEPIPHSSFHFWREIERNGKVKIDNINFTIPLSAQKIDYDDGMWQNSGPSQSFTFPNSELYLSDFVITKEEINTLINGGRNNCNQDDLFKKETEKLKYTKTKSLNSQIDVIHSLLKTYCPEAIEHPHKALGKKGALTKAFSYAGIEFPVDVKTLSNWINSRK